MTATPHRQDRAAAYPGLDDGFRDGKEGFLSQVPDCSARNETGGGPAA